MHRCGRRALGHRAAVQSRGHSGGLGHPNPGQGKPRPLGRLSADAHGLSRRRDVWRKERAGALRRSGVLGERAEQFRGGRCWARLETAGAGQSEDHLSADGHPVRGPLCGADLGDAAAVQRALRFAGSAVRLRQPCDGRALSRLGWEEPRGGEAAPAQLPNSCWPTSRWCCARR